ncbi:hypothetical protein MATL_G00182190 [Megalops atlanticus]|uniref:Uncharacterized protein n=1 Tax=Megalops atlanticus TaxID=7932 RepID=A0A9D3PNA3_MEGAT|nr:hypothetical protein MATL_G00182190 [Megalops atlanticus]
MDSLGKPMSAAVNIEICSGCHPHIYPKMQSLHFRGSMFVVPRDPMVHIMEDGYGITMEHTHAIMNMIGRS